MRTSRSEGGLAGWKAVGVAALVVAGVGLRAVNRMNRRNPSRTEEAQLAEQEEAARQATGAQISLNEMTDAMQLPHPAKIERGDDFVIADVARIPTIAGHAWGAVGAAPLATSRSETTGSRYVGVADDGESKVILEIDEQEHRLYCTVAEEDRLHELRDELQAHGADKFLIVVRYNPNEAYQTLATKKSRLADALRDAFLTRDVEQAPSGILKLFVGYSGKRQRELSKEYAERTRDELRELRQRVG